MRDRIFSICKGIGIILVVLGHSGCPGYLSRFVSLFHMPLFFISAGYFFHLKYLNDEKTFVVRRLRGLYVPFVKWSVLFLCLHNLFFWTGILNEKFGTASGGVLHPYTWQQFQQRVWSCVFNMSGYDEFLTGTFWFFRALLVTSLAYLVLFKLLRRVRWLKSDVQIGWAICAIALLLALWKVVGGLRVTGLAQGGYRDIMGVFFFGVGFLYRQYRHFVPMNWKWAAGCFAFLLLATFTFGTSMGYTANFVQFISFPLPALAGFWLCYYVSKRIDAWGGWLARGLDYIGERTLYVFAFHFLAFKVVSAVVVAYYGLSWLQVGGHPVVYHGGGGDAFFLLYTLVGVGLPLGVREVYLRVKPDEPVTLSTLSRAGRAVRDWATRVYDSCKRIVEASLPKDD